MASVGDSFKLAERTVHPLFIDQIDPSFLSVKNSAAIIQSPEFFRRAFYQALFQLQPQCLPPAVHISSNGPTLMIERGEPETESLHRVIEKIREIFAKTLQEGSEGSRLFGIVPLNRWEFYSLFNQPAEFIDYRFFFLESSDENEAYQTHVAPVLSGFFRKLGIKGFVSSFPMKENLFEKEPAQNAFSYLLPLKIPQRRHAETALYPFYEEQKFCSWSITGGQKTIRVDETVLFLRGESSIQTMMTHILEEKGSKTLFLGDVSLNTIKAFTCYLYLGQSGLSPKFASENQVLLDELLEIAYKYEMASLRDHCTNLICLFASEKDAKPLQSLAELHGNDHLQDLCMYFARKKEVSAAHTLYSQNGCIDFSSIQWMLDKKMVGEIIQNPTSFWFAFCKIFSEIEYSKRKSFNVILDQDCLKIQGQPHAVNAWQSLVEELRELLLQAWNEKRSSTILFVPITASMGTFQEKAPSIFLSHWRYVYSKRQIGIDREGMRSMLTDLCKLLGASCTHKNACQKVFFSDHDVDFAHDVDAFAIDWIVPHSSIYPRPKEISPRSPFREELYMLYEKQLLCDFILAIKKKDSEEAEISLNIHSSILLAHGGNIQKIALELLSQEKRLVFQDISPKTLHALVRYLYLGPEALSPEWIQENEISIEELLHIGYTYRLMLLIDSCVNSIAFFASPEKLKEIRILAERYPHFHLEQLCIYLSQLQRL